MELDEVGSSSLNGLQADARLTKVEFAELVWLSPTLCARLIKILEQSGVISRYVALLDQKAGGLPVSVFVNVTLERQVEQALEGFEATILRRPEVMECYLMTGDADYLLRVVVADLDAYERFIIDHLTKVPGIANIKSSFALKQVAYKTALPINDAIQSSS